MAKEAKTRDKIVALANSWVGINEADGSYKKILDVYNSQEKLPRNVKMKPGMAWCATTWSALAIVSDYTDIIPVECSCGQLVELAKKMGIWVEDDNYMPKPGDAVLFDWQDSGKGDNKGWPDHIGMVVSVSGSSFTTVEGNYSKSVKKRVMKQNQKQIRGFICPKYDDPKQDELSKIVDDVIAGKYGNGKERIERINNANLPYDYKTIQDAVNKKLKK